MIEAQISRPELAVYGSASLDLVFSGLADFPKPGQEVIAEKLEVLPGGALITPFVAARLGIRSAFCGTVGHDYFGQLLRSQLGQMDMDVAYLAGDEHTGTSVSAVLPAGSDRGFATYFEPSDYEAEAVMLANARRDGAVRIHAYLSDIYNAKDTPVLAELLDPGWLLTLDSGWDERLTFDNCAVFIKQAEIFFTNEDELRQLSDGDTEAGIGLLRSWMSDPANRLRLVVLKTGSMGSTLIRQEEEHLVLSIDIGQKVDSTGAGDSYGAGFLAGLMRGLDDRESARLASAAGGMAVTYYGGVNDAFDAAAVVEAAGLKERIS